MINLITGYKGKPHLEAAEQGLFNAGVCGNSVVLPTNNRFSYVINSNNSITIESGDLVNQGRHISIPYNSSETVTIENGKTGYKRIDTIVVRYSKNPDTLIESSEILVIKGTAVEDNLEAEAPSIISGNIFAGATQDDFPLYDIHINGLNIETVVPRFNIIMSAAELTDKAEKTITNNVITAVPVSNFIINNDDVAQKIDLFLDVFSGNKFITKNGSILIGPGVNKILVQGNLIIRSTTTHNGIFFIYKNERTYAHTTIDIGDNTIDKAVISPRLIRVKEGDVISMYVKGSKNDRISNDPCQTYITVQAVG